MKDTKRYRWVCPECGAGKLLGKQPPLNLTDRYCLECSKTTGMLVARTCPVLDRKRKAGRERSKARAKKKREQMAQKWVVAGINLKQELARIWRIAQRLEPALAGRPRPKLAVFQRKGRYSSGHTYALRKIHITCGTDPADIRYVLAHEVAHSICRIRGGGCHDDIFKAAEAELLHDTGIRGRN